MNANTESAPTAEEYSQAMNLIGSNLFSSLVQSMEKLQPHFRNQKMVSNALSSFLVNVIYKQSSGNTEKIQQMLDEILNLVKIQLDSIP
ncbi:hypothetical protein [Legionella worsleiensis]|uniref:Uncharacterized protein n=1 Tax=Legionella worsleiensis TaxID=45076 RepID=A0A0W1A776_9GAMM|nr:hypothetical protein [Legionella worsleiensis]KTD76899.1 hypothetical protein Lwor_2124 [Legionella worsleiensis]STY33431.1 Uncharacterised protein [Legionella worsleiensis]